MNEERVMNVWNFMVAHAKTYDKVPSVKTIAKGTSMSIRQTRRTIGVMEEIGMLRRTIHGFAPPKGWTATEAMS